MVTNFHAGNASEPTQLGQSLTVLESFLFLRNRVGSLLQDPSAHNSLSEEQLANLALS